MRRAAALAALALLVAGCGGEGTLTVYAASSLREVFQQLAPDARFNFGGSGELAFQIEEGARADVFASASPAYAARLRAEGLVEEPHVVARNQLVLIVSARAGRHVDLGGLSNPRLKLVLAQAGVPAGDYARKVIRRVCGRATGLGARCPAAKIVSAEPDVKGVLAKVALGEADFGFVYATDAKAGEGSFRVVPVPAAIQPEIAYAIAVVKDAPHRAEAERFVELVLGPKGRSALRGAGFGLP